MFRGAWRVLLISLACVMLLAQVAFASCDPGSQYSSDPAPSHFAGREITSSIPSAPTGIQASWNTYNTFEQDNVSTWVMAVGTSCSACFAQTGVWDVSTSSGGTGAPEIWVAVSNANGYWNVMKNPSSPNGWCNVGNGFPNTSCPGQNQSSGTHSYMIHQDISNSQRWFAEMDGSVWFENTTDLGWSQISRFPVAGEVHSERDQSPGDKTTHVHFSGIQLDNSGWFNATLGVTSTPTYSTWQKVGIPSSNSFDIWDDRCS
jgi:hypothetical protein